MKKLKCWKKIEDRKTEFEFIREDGGGVYGFAKLGGWVVRKFDDTPFRAKDLIRPLKAKTKEEALSFAQKYMGEYDIC